jgi:uncharacterized protein YkwD
MDTALRFLTIVAAIVPLALMLTPMLHARPQSSAADVTLLNAANRDRAAAGLSPLKWDGALATAAHQHALRMAKADTLSHQLPGEPPMQDRARRAGAHFSMVAENIAQGPSVPGLHTQWMNSPPHRATLLDPQLNAVGISVVRSGNTYFAVEDFATTVAAIRREEPEQQIASPRTSLGLQKVSATADARQTCELGRGWSDQRPASVVRYETAAQLPEDVGRKVSAGKYHAAAVGARDADGPDMFARYRIAIPLF